MCGHHTINKSRGNGLAIGHKSINKINTTLFMVTELNSWFSDLWWRPAHAVGGQRSVDLLVSVKVSVKKWSYVMQTFIYNLFLNCIFVWFIHNEHDKFLRSPPSNTTPWQCGPTLEPSEVWGAAGLSSGTPRLRRWSSSRTEGVPRCTPPTWAHLSRGEQFDETLIAIFF